MATARHGRRQREQQPLRGKLHTVQEAARPVSLCPHRRRRKNTGGILSPLLPLPPPPCSRVPHSEPPRGLFQPGFTHYPQGSLPPRAGDSWGPSRRPEQPPNPNQRPRTPVAEFGQALHRAELRHSRLTHRTSSSDPASEVWGAGCDPSSPGSDPQTETAEGWAAGSRWPRFWLGARPLRTRVRQEEGGAGVGRGQVVLRCLLGCPRVEQPVSELCPGGAAALLGTGRPREP